MTKITVAFSLSFINTVGYLWALVYFGCFSTYITILSSFSTCNITIGSFCQLQHKFWLIFNFYHLCWPSFNICQLWLSLSFAIFGLFLNSITIEDRSLTRVKFCFWLTYNLIVGCSLISTQIGYFWPSTSLTIVWFYY